MQKWEYCEVSVTSGEVVTIKYYGADNNKIRKSERIKNTDEMRDRAKQIVAQLGLDGWELVNVRDNGLEYWFKRPIES